MNVVIMLRRSVAPANIANFGFEQAIRLLGKAFFIAQTGPAFALNHCGGAIRVRHNGLQILFKTIVANAIVFEGVVKVVHVDQNATLIAPRPLLKPKIQTAGRPITFGGCRRHSFITSDWFSPLVFIVALIPKISPLRFLAEEVAADTYVNVMAQYHPAGKVTAGKYAEINHPLTTREYEAAVQSAGDLGLRLDVRRQVRRVMR